MVKTTRIIWVTVEAPISKERFKVQVPVEVDEGNPETQIVQKAVLEDGLSVNDTYSIAFWQDSQKRDQARREISAAAERYKNPADPINAGGYTNLQSFEHGIGVHNQKVSQKRHDEGML